MQKMSLDRQKRQLWMILLSFGLFSFSRGLWYNYQTLWLQDNHLSITTISSITGLASLLSVSVIFLFSNLIQRRVLKNFVTILLFLKSLVLFILFLLNGSSFPIIVKFLIMVDLVLDTYITTSIYPVISLVKKSNTIYSIKGIISSTFYDLGLLCSGFILGKVLFGLSISYNLFLLIAFLFTVVASFLMLLVHVEFSTETKSLEIQSQNSDFFANFTKFLMKDKISKLYFGYVFLGNICFYAVYGLRMLLLTDVVSLQANQASFYLLMVGIISDVVSILVLKYFTSKNYFVNVLVKFGGRFIFYLLAFLTNNVFVFMFALFYTMLFSEAYSHITDAPYINRLQNQFQFAFVNLKGMLSKLAEAIGIWLCGFFFLVGIQYMFLLITVIILFQILVMFKLYQLQNK